MRISVTEPSSVICSQTKQYKKVKSDVIKCQNNAKTKWDGIQNYNFNEF